MVYYFVIGGDGQRYGPADIDALVQWAREGRLVGETTLIERGTDRQLRADSITAISVALQRLSGITPPASVEPRSDFSREAPTMSVAPSPRPAAPPPPPPPSAQPIVSRSREVINDNSSRSRLAAGLLGIFLGGLGIHRFYLGYKGMGLLMLLLSLGLGTLTGGVTCSFVHLWGLIEGIVILSGGFKDADGRPLRS